MTHPGAAGTAACGGDSVSLMHQSATAGGDAAGSEWLPTRRVSSGCDGDKDVRILAQPGLNLRVVADLAADAVQALRGSSLSVVIQADQVRVGGVSPETLIALFRDAATRYGAAKEHFAGQLRTVPLSDPHADQWLERWSAAGVRHEQALLSIEQIRSRVGGV